MALFAVLSMMATGCQKENNEIIGMEPVVVKSGTVYTMQYVIDGVQHITTLYGESERAAFIYQMLTLAEQGNEVMFFDPSTYSQDATRDVVYFSTADKAEAVAWADHMLNEGYKVTVTYDPSTSTFNCVAWK